jgi:GT2 family glycosyltransferase
MKSPITIRKLKALLPGEDVLAGLSARIAGVLDVRLRNARVVGGYLELETDSQIEFTLKRFIAATAVVAQIRVEAVSRDVKLKPRLYLDYGAEYNEDTVFHMSPDGEDAWTCHVPAPHLVRKIRIDLTEAPGTVVLGAIVAQRAPLTRLVSDLLSMDGRYRTQVAKGKVEFGLDLLGRCAARIAHGDEKVNHALAAEVAASAMNHVPSGGFRPDDEYLDWIDRYETLTDADREWMARRAAGFARQVTFSILMPVYSPPLDLLSEAIESLRAQTYPHWELCIADDASKDDAVRLLIQEHALRDPRIRFVFREENGHISRATNSAAELATGDFLVLMDNDDLIPPHALFTVAHYVDANPGCRMLFSDEDKINLSGFRCDPYRKGAFDRFLMYGHNMFSHLGIYARDLFEEAGRFRVGFEGSQDYDLTLRCMELCDDAQVVHIPHVLYHWRQIPGSTSLGPGEKSYAFEAAKRAINDHFARRSYPLLSVNAEVPGVSVVRTLAQRPATITVVIPTKDGLDVLRPCVDSLLAHPDPMVDVVVVDNGSEEAETREYLDGLARDAGRFTVVRDDGGFNFSRIVNLGVAHARGEIVCLLNNDTELLNGLLWERARAWLSMADVGIVGARLLYPDRTLQHYGVYVGIGDHGVADHVHLGLPDPAHAQFSKSRLIQQFSAVTAACLFARKADYLAVGGFDEGIAVAYNDVDFCLRIRARGLKVVCDPEVRLVHKESKSRGHDDSPAKAARLGREAATVRARWGDGLEDPFYNPNFSRENPRFQVPVKSRIPIPWKEDFGRGAFRPARPAAAASTAERPSQAREAVDA